MPNKNDIKLFNNGLPVNRRSIVLPSSGIEVYVRETTVTELKSISKIVIDNLGCRQFDVIYDSITQYLQSMIVSDGVDVNSEFTDFDRLFCLMAFFQMSFFNYPMDIKCPNCGVDIKYRYDMSKYLKRMEGAYVSDQTIEVVNKSKRFIFTIGWPLVKTMSMMNKYFYSYFIQSQNDGVSIEELERTQYGINLLMSFIKNLKMINSSSGEVEYAIDFDELGNWQDRIDIINSLPSSVVFDEENGVFSKISGYFINRLENCFGFELCPMCHKETNYGLSQSSHFYSLFYGSLKSMYGFIIQAECLLVYKFQTGIFDKEQYMTYNDFNSLVHQIGNTAEKEADERKKQMSNDTLVKGLWYIREILNNLVFPQDKKH